MLALKSNHDIQVMIGGLNALLRIFYATKYVTKMQEHIDSITAVALAVFQRCQLREARDEEAATNIDRATIGRRRVASLLYAITNRRETAGPLAALYVQRGSCAFMSSPCATLSLRTVLHELVDQVPHSCDLVALRGCDSDVTFRAASFLDDCSYRPPGLDHLYLYEYVARHFRRKRTRTTLLFSSRSTLFLTRTASALTLPRSCQLWSACACPSSRLSARSRCKAEPVLSRTVQAVSRRVGPSRRSDER
jgi:hypothetical protein